MPKVTKKYLKFSVEEHIRNKTFWSGSKNNVPSKEYVIVSEDKNNETIQDISQIKCVNITYTPTLKQMFLEAIVNVFDLQERGITLSIDMLHNGEIHIENSAPGIPIVKHNDTNMWVPQFICDEMCGSNLETDDKHISGGTNGIGLKVIICNSKYFRLLTSDEDTRQIFSITFEDCKKIKGEPMIISYDSIMDPAYQSLKKEFTRLEFIPDYKLLGYTNYIENGYSLMKNVIKTYLYYAKMYRPDMNIIFNRQNINIKIHDDISRKKINHEEKMILSGVKDIFKSEICKFKIYNKRTIK